MVVAGVGKTWYDNIEKECTHLRVRKDPEWFQTMSNLAISESDPNIRVSVIAVAREEDPSEYTHLITEVFHSPGFSNYDPELKKLPNLTSASFLTKLDKNCGLISTEKVTTELDSLKATLNMRSVRYLKIQKGWLNGKQGQLEN